MFLLTSCSLIYPDPGTPIATLPPTLTLPVRVTSTPAPTITETSTQHPVCTPPPCAPDEVYFCPDECPGGCGTTCATHTPLAASAETPSQEITSIRFAVIGDFGLAGDPEAEVAALVKSWEPDFILTVGDNNYPDGAPETIDENIGQYYQEYIFPYKGSYGPGSDINRFFPTLGNHDWTTHQAQAYFDYFELPGNERYYDFVWGPVHFFAIDSDSREPDGVGRSSIQAQWLQAQLASSTAPWKIVYMHHPPYASTSSEPVDWIRWPFQDWGADIVIAGHDHFYERLEVDGFPYIINGLGGGPIYAFGDTYPGSQVRYNADQGALFVEADKNRVSFSFQTRTGELIDSFLLSASSETPAPELPSVVAFPNPADYQWSLVTEGLKSPIGIAHAGDGLGRLFILEQPGLIRILQEGQIIPTLFLDIQSKVGSEANEQGLLGLAFHPNYEQNGTFFLNYTDLNGNTVISRFQVSADPNLADPASETPILRINQPYDNHNGGHIAFGPDGYLYIGMGDGGSAGDLENNAQNLSTLLGKMLRLDVDGAAPYAIPGDNPYVNGEGLPEIWAWGLRNPWKFSFDRKTEDLYIADVGQKLWEEIHFLAAPIPGGVNFGWKFWEGLHLFEGQPPENASFDFPIWEYGHELGCSVTGGVVYRGALPEWQGIYVYGDFCSGRIWGLLRDTNGNWQNTQLFQTDYNIAAFGEDEAGELYLVARRGEVYTLTRK
jgi:glucose/arabinose dehydrogenase